MARKITELTAAGAVLGTDLLWLEQTGDVPRKLTIANLESALGLQPIKQAEATFQPDGTTWRRVATSVGGGAGRGAAIIHVSNDGGSGAPGVYKFRVSKSWQTDGTDMQIQVLSAMGTNAGTINQARLCQSTAGGSVHFEVLIQSQGSSVNWYVEVMPELTNAFDVWSAVAFTSGAPEDTTRSVDFTTIDPYFGVYSPASNDTPYFAVTSGGNYGVGGGSIPALTTLTQADTYAFLNRGSTAPALYVVQTSTGPAIRAGLGTLGSTTFTEYVDIGRSGNLIEMVSGAPKIRWHETDATANEGEWDIVAASDELLFRTRGDGDVGGESYMTVTRAGSVVENLNFNANTINIDTDNYIDLDDTSTTVGIRMRTAGTQRGYFYADATGIGILHDGGGWSIRNNHTDDSVTITGVLYPNNQSTGNIQAVTGNYGSVQCGGADGSSGTWGGWSIDGRFVFMGHPTEQRCGIYDDVDNIWALQWNHGNAASNEELALYCRNGTSSVQAAITQGYTATGVTTGMRLIGHDGGYRDVGWNELPIEVTNASATLAAQHCGQVIYSNNSTTYTVTTPSNTALDFPVGGMCTIINLNTTGNININQGSGVTLYWLNGSSASGNRVLGNYGVANVWRHSSGAFFVWGIGLS
jgi:hypothetical protein